MAAVVSRHSLVTTNNLTAYATTNFTPTQDDLLVVFALVTGTTVATPTCTENAGGGTYTLVSETLGNASADRLYVFVANQLVGASPPARSITVGGLSADAGTGAVVHVIAITGMSRTGTNAIKQAGEENDRLASQTPTVVFGSNITAGNPVAGFYSNNANPAAGTPPSGWTELLDTGFATPTSGFESAKIDSHAGGTTTVTWGAASATRGGSVAIEFDASSSGTPVGKDLQLIWNINAAVGKSLQTIWNVRAVVGKSLQTIWNVLTLVAKTLQFIWHVLTPVGKSVQFLWNLGAPVGKSLQTIWNTNSVAGKSLQLIWHILTPVGKSLQVIWNVRSTVGKSVQFLWNVRANVGVSLQLVWNVRGTAGTTLQIIWNVNEGLVVNRDLQMVWNVRANAGKSLQLVWNVRTLAGKNLQFVWNVGSVVGKSLQLIWNIRAVAGKTLDLLWNVAALNNFVGRDLQMIWNVRKVVAAVTESELLAGNINTTFDTNIDGWVGRGNDITWENGAARLTRITSGGIFPYSINPDVGTLDIPIGGNVTGSVRMRASRTTNIYFFVSCSSGESIFDTRVITTEWATYTFPTTLPNVNIFYVEIGYDESAAVGDWIEFDDVAIYQESLGLQLKWNVLTPVNKDLQTVWNVQSLAGKSLEVPWNTRAIVGRELFMFWNVQAITQVGKNLFIVWNVKVPISKNLQLSWNVLTVVNRTRQFIWHVRKAEGKSLDLRWNTNYTFTWVPVNNPSISWTPENPSGDAWTPVSPDSETWTPIPKDGSSWS